MKSITIIMSFFLISNLTYAQSSNESYYPIASPSYIWKTPSNKLEITNFLKTEKSKYFNYFNKDSISFGYDFTKTGLLNALHTLDLNKDGVDEIIFNGLSDEEGNKTEIFQKINNKYVNVFSTRQNIVDIKLSDTASYLFITDPGCCAEYSIIQKIFKMNIPSQAISFNQIYQSQLLNSTVKPDNVFQTPIPIKITVDKSKLRFQPKLDDTATQFYDLMGDLKPTGNVVANFKTNTKGLALGDKTDSLGNKWLYVQLDLGYYLNNFKLDDRIGELSKFYTKIIGWVSDQNIKMDYGIVSKQDFTNLINNQLDNLSKKQQDCLDKGIAMNGCVMDYNSGLDVLLNQVYQMGLSKISNRLSKQKYISDQRTWLKYRDAEFNKNYKSAVNNGTMGMMVAHGENAEIVKKRVLYLLGKI